MQNENYDMNGMPLRMPPFQRQDDSASLIWKVDPEDVIDEIIHYLRGDFWDNDNRKWIINKDKERRLCNDIGIAAIEATLRGCLNKNLILTNLDQDMINKMALENALNFIRLLYTSWERFDIKRENLTLILQIIDTNVYATLRRSKEGFFVNHLSTTQRYIEQSNITNQETGEKKRFLPNIFGQWGGDKNA